MNPTVGRIVHYWDGEGRGPFAAIVTGQSVQSGFTVLTVFEPGSTYHATAQHITADPIGPHWDWPVRS